MQDDASEDPPVPDPEIQVMYGMRCVLNVNVCPDAFAVLVGEYVSMLFLLRVFGSGYVAMRNIWFLLLCVKCLFFSPPGTGGSPRYHPASGHHTIESSYSILF